MLSLFASIREVEKLKRFECNITVEPPPSPISDHMMDLTSVRDAFIMYLRNSGIQAENVSGPGEYNCVWHRVL